MRIGAEAPSAANAVLSYEQWVNADGVDKCGDM